MRYLRAMHFLMQGKCVCGVCVCYAGWDGSADCTFSFDGDGYNTLFTYDPLYSLVYNGLPVVDQRALIETAQGSGTPDTGLPPNGRNFAGLVVYL